MSVRLFYGRHLLAIKIDEEAFYYHYNRRGDVIAMTDKDGNKAAEYDYGAWGNVLKSSIINPKVESNPFGYAGYMYDKEIEMYYLIARYYHPEHGVFLSVDPDSGDEDDSVEQNGYTYANNNPVHSVGMVIKLMIEEFHMLISQKSPIKK